MLTAEQVGTPAQVENYIVQNDANTYNAGTPLTHAWPTPATIYYAFDAGATLTAADESGFRQAMALYQDIANIAFVTADATHAADLVITTNSAGTAETAYVVTNEVAGGVTMAVASTATISIDTQVNGWTNLSGLGTNDTSGNGGYGFLTVLHELGHAIGFGHPGPYNDGGVSADFLSSQNFYTDTHQYSVMSYISASQSGADWTDGTVTIRPQTPMLYDIGAAQMLYGANTGVLAGHDTFGFHSSFAANSALSVYNFTANAVPVVTLYDAGQDNTLDLSGFGAASYVNLNPGAFSNAGGLTGNIGISYGTTINAAVGGSGNDTFVVVNGLADYHRRRRRRQHRGVRRALGRLPHRRQCRHRHRDRHAERRRRHADQRATAAIRRHRRACALLRARHAHPDRARRGAGRGAAAGRGSRRHARRAAGAGRLGRLARGLDRHAPTSGRPT